MIATYCDLQNDLLWFTVTYRIYNVCPCWWRSVKKFLRHRVPFLLQYHCSCKIVTGSVDMQPSVSREGFKYDLWDLGPGTLEANPCVEYPSSLSSSVTVIIRWGIILSSMKRMSKSLLYATLFCARWYLTIFPLFVIYIRQSLKSISKCRAAKFISMPYGSYFWRLYQGSHRS